MEIVYNRLYPIVISRNVEIKPAQGIYIENRKKKAVNK